ncbi:MAG: DUF2461 family protein [Candidatus Ventricola sp.]
MFTGFSEDAIHFLTDIQLNNTPAFYEANRQRYEEQVKAPLRALCEEMMPVVQMIDPGLDTRPGRTMSRIRRDTRFSRDKSPFRDHVWLGWRYPGESRSEGFGLYWGFGPDWLSWGCGCYAADKPLMDALRLHIRRQPDDVRRALCSAGAGYEMYGEAYRRITVPDDVPEDLRALYVRKGFGLEHSGTQAEWAALHTHQMADILARELTALAPLQQLMRRMRQSADAAQAILERENTRQAPQAVRPARLSVRGADEFEF